MQNFIRNSFGLLIVLILNLSLVLPVQAVTLLPGSFLPGDDTIGTASESQLIPAIAAGNGNFLAVWSDQRAMAPAASFYEVETSGDIYGIRLDADGNLLDELPFVITAGQGWQEYPQVAWNGTHWLVVYESYTVNGTGYYYEKSLEAVRVAPDGTLIDTTPIRIYNIVPINNTWTVASDGDNWVVAFQGTSASLDLMAIRISADGVVLDPPIHSLVPGTYYMRFNLRLAYANGVFLLTWSDFSDTLGIRFDQQINLLDAEPLALVSGSIVESLASNGSQFYAVWNAQQPDWSMAATGSRISADGVMLDGEGVNISQDNDPEANTDMGVVWDGSNWKAFWGFQGVSVARIAPDGSVLDPGGVQFAGMTPGPGAAGPTGSLQIVWSTYTSYDVHTASISAGFVGGPLKDISLGAPAQLQPNLAQGSAGYMVVFRSDISGQNRVMAQPLDLAGNPLLAEPVQLDSGGTQNGPGAPSVAWNGSLYLVAWSESNGIYAQRILQDGTLVDASPFYVMEGFGSVDVAALGNLFLITGLQYGFNIEIVYAVAARVNGTNGSVLDPDGLLVGSSFVRQIAVTELAGKWLVVWQVHATHDENPAVTYANFVNADGTFGTEFFVYGGYPTSQYSFGPDVVSNGQVAFVVQVNEISSGVEMDAVGRFVYPDGSLGSTITLTPWQGNQYRPRVAWDGSNFIVVYQDQRNRFAIWELDQLDARSDLFGMRVTGDGTLLDPRGFLLSNSPQAEAAPSIVAQNGLSLISSSILRNEPYAAYRVGYDFWGEGGNAWPVAVASASPDEGIVPLEVSFNSSGSTDPDGSLVAYAWDFGDGASSTEANPAHTYTGGGPFVATLTVTDDQGAQTTNTVLVWALLPNQLPLAQANAVPDIGPAPLNVVFNASGSYDPDGSLGNFYWTFSDGGDYWGSTAYHTFNSPGLHHATLTVYDNRGGTGTDVVTVTVTGPNVAPVLAPIGDKSVDELETLVFTATATDANQPPQLLTFSLGAGAPEGASIDPLSGVFTWTPPEGSAPGTYPLTVIVTDDGVPPLTDSETIQITVNELQHPAPLVDAGVDQSALEGQVLSFTGTYTEAGLTLGGSLLAVGIQWDFGDGTLLTGTLTPTHAYANDGEFVVTLVVTDGFGSVGQDSLLVTVENVLPQVEPLEPELSVMAGEALTITGSFSDAGLLDAHTVTVAWGDGLTDTLELEPGVFEFTISHIYASAGTYTVTLSVADEDGGTLQTFVVLVSEVPEEVGYLVSLPLVQK